MHISNITDEPGWIMNRFLSMSIIASSIRGELSCNKWCKFKV